MRSRLIGWSVFSFITGFLVCAAVTIDPVYAPPEEKSIAYHWKKVREYREHMDNRDNFTSIPGSDMASTTPPFDILPHLAILDDLGEIEHLDVVLPSVSDDCRAAWKFFMKSSSISYKSNKLIYGIGAAHPATLHASGQQPFRFHFWVKNDFVDEIIDMVQKVEEIAARECDNNPSSRTNIEHAE